MAMSQSETLGHLLMAPSTIYTLGRSSGTVPFRDESAPAGRKKAKIDDGKGRQSMKIDVDSILSHLRSCSLQDTPKLIHRANHDDTQRFIQLEGRDTTVSDAVTLLKRSHDAHEKKTADRTT
eukprot:scaffold290907_cov53-Attheya_sp.AAC.1